MSAPRGSIIIFLLLFFFPRMGISSVHRVDRQKGEPYEEVIDLIKEKAFQKAFERLKDKKGIDKNGADYLSLKAFLFTQVGERKKPAAQRHKHFKKGEALAKRAIEKESEHAFAHFALAMALGRMIEHASPSEKLEHARAVKKEAEKALKHDSTLAGPHHILGRWHKNIADISTLEHWTIKVLYGKLPEGSFRKALEHFKQAARKEPKEALHYYEMGLTYHKMGRSVRAKEAVKKALKLAQQAEDEEIEKKCTTFLGISGD
ncbi:MAG: hypothetical protein ABEH38_05240 [Flavobacteriales bacterium]